MTEHLHPRTRMIHDGSHRSPHGEMSEALYLTQGFAYPNAETAEARFDGSDPGYVYARYGNPTVGMFEERLASLEGAEACFATASGMAAVNAALFSRLSAGDHMVSARALFGSCDYIIGKLLPRFGVETTMVDGPDPEAWKRAMRPETKFCFLETPSNPTLELIDIEAVARIAHEGGAELIVDNVFATPCFQRPLELGADMVMYSTTKHIDGQGRCLGGALLGSRETIRGPILEYMKHTGAAMSPFNAWVMLKGLETIHLRCEAQAAGAAALAAHLSTAPGVKRVLYPGLPDHPQHALARKQMGSGGTMVAIEVADKEAAFRFLNAFRIIKISNNVGDAKSIATHPSTTTHQRMTEEERLSLGITQGMIRLSVGLEATEDLIADMNRGIAALS